MGSRVSEETARLFADDEYQQYLYLHGLGVEMAEALAEYWHRRIREELGFADEDGPTLTGLFRQKYRGGRYSWGYPACPDLEDNAKVVELLGRRPDRRRGRARASSSTPSSRRPPSSATTPRPSTSSPEGRSEVRDPVAAGTPTPAARDRYRQPFCHRVATLMARARQ